MASEQKIHKIFYKHEGLRSFAFVYDFSPDTGKIQYGAAILRKNNSNEPFYKKSHRNTAEERLKIRPGCFTIDINDYNDLENDLQKYNFLETVIRKRVGSHGVKGVRISRK